MELEDSKIIRYLAGVNHERNDSISLELGRQVARRLRDTPKLLEVGRANLARWSRQNADSPSLLRCYAEWQRILEQPLESICELLCAKTDESQRLRQNSPFAGVLPPAEVWKIKREIRDHAKRST